MNKQTKTELERIVRAASHKLNVIKDAEARKEAEQYVGRCFRYRNCYSCPDKPSDYWWIYFRVVGTARYGHVVCFRFQTDKYGEFTLRAEYQTSTNTLGEEIPEKQFFKELKKAREKVARLMDEVLEMAA